MKSKARSEKIISKIYKPLGRLTKAQWDLEDSRNRMTQSTDFGKGTQVIQWRRNSLFKIR